jgi:hypothetical protein
MRPDEDGLPDVTRESYARFSETPAVKFRRPTHPGSNGHHRSTDG